MEFGKTFAMGIGARIKARRGEMNISRTELAKQAMIPYPTLAGIENGDQNGTPKAWRIAEILKCRVLWLETGEGPIELPASAKAASDPSMTPAIPVAPAAHLIPQMNVSASMGTGADIPEHLEIVRNIAVDIDHLRRVASFSNPKNLSFITAYGDSMEGTYSDGDVLLIDQGVTEIKYDAVYALEKGDELFVKRIQRRSDGTLVMLSDNKLYEPQPITKSELPTFRVRGRVVLAWNTKKL